MGQDGPCAVRDGPELSGMAVGTQRGSARDSYEACRDPALSAPGLHVGQGPIRSLNGHLSPSVSTLFHLALGQSADRRNMYPEEAGPAGILPESEPLTHV